MKGPLLTLLLVFSLAFNIAFVGIWARARTSPRPAQAGSRPGPRVGAGRAGTGRRPPWAEMGLRPEQERRIRQSWQDVGQRTEALRAEAATRRDRFLELMEAEGQDEEALAAELQAIEQLDQQIRKLVTQQMIETRNLLTAEQRSSWLRLMRARGERMGWGPPPRGNRRHAAPREALP